MSGVQMTCDAQDLGAREVGARVRFTASSGAVIEDVLVAVYAEPRSLPDSIPERPEEDVRIQLFLLNVYNARRPPGIMHSSLLGFEVALDAQVRVTYPVKPGEGVLDV